MKHIFNINQLLLFSSIVPLESQATVFFPKLMVRGMKIIMILLLYLYPPENTTVTVAEYTAITL